MKIILNSPPRSGSTYLLNILRMSYARDDKNKDLYDVGEWVQDKTFITKKHEPLLFLIDDFDISHILILRNPLDTISSSITKSLNGQGISTIAGIPQQLNTIAIKNDKANYYHQLIHQESKMYEAYLYYAEKNPKTIFIKFDDLINDLDKCLIEIHERASVKETIIIPSEKLILSAMEEYKEKTKYDTNYGNGFANIYPTQKPEIYFKIKEDLAQDDRILKLDLLYKNAISKY